jgi:hypothetical protein
VQVVLALDDVPGPVIVLVAEVHAAVRSARERLGANSFLAPNRSATRSSKSWSVSAAKDRIDPGSLADRSFDGAPSAPAARRDA